MRIVTGNYILMPLQQEFYIAGINGASMLTG
jgi:hypothetical protein